MKLIPAGKFTMGCADNERGYLRDQSPQHQVTISKPFYMGIYDVTQEQYEQVMGTNPSNFKGPHNPVETVSWNEAVEFCEKLSQKTGKKVQLPTEAQWEYACRAGSKTRFYFGDDPARLGDYAWCKGRPYGANDGVRLLAVGQKKPNDWGLYDMPGNVWQWCSDHYDLYPARRSRADDCWTPAGISSYATAVGPATMLCAGQHPEAKPHPRSGAIKSGFASS